MGYFDLVSEGKALECRESLSEIVILASEAILRVYADEGLWQSATKQDSSPVTQADLDANSVILQGLHRHYPDVPYVSEEGDTLNESSEGSALQSASLSQTYWLIDPLDGTKEFLAKNGEFTVNIGLIRNGLPLMGMVWQPVASKGWFGVCGRVGGEYQAAFRCEMNEGVCEWSQMRARSTQIGQPVTVLQSRSHQRAGIDGILDKIRSTGSEPRVVAAGSSLKMCQIAEGVADIYPRMGPTSEWDTAAAQAVLVAAGGSVIDFETKAELTYGKRGDYLNPSFLAGGAGVGEWLPVLN